MFRIGVIRFGSMDTWGGPKERMPIQRLRHLRSTKIWTLLSSASSTGLIVIVKPIVVHSWPRYMMLSGFCVISLGISWRSSFHLGQWLSPSSLYFWPLRWTRPPFNAFILWLRCTFGQFHTMRVASTLSVARPSAQLKKKMWRLLMTKLIQGVPC